MDGIDEILFPVRIGALPVVGADAHLNKLLHCYYDAYGSYVCPGQYPMDTVLTNSSGAGGGPLNYRRLLVPAKEQILGLGPQAAPAVGFAAFQSTFGAANRFDLF
ncbi:hypothetical protein [Bradyrhizobium arachidis]|uniref:hypothetical protein n=1 Tax=Bradyrhizobium arachidis TaxID=858423 RepID=UPI002163EAB8|nr:hypothetical protein [Bradyrhizobium arachidis]UVO27585.1 hypothetical protein KUF59_34665 [Bradyrhizobium arachidis]